MEGDVGDMARAGERVLQQRPLLRGCQRGSEYGVNTTPQDNRGPDRPVRAGQRR